MESKSNQKVVISNIAPISTLSKVSMTICEGQSRKTNWFYDLNFQRGQAFWDIPNWKDGQIN